MSDRPLDEPSEADDSAPRDPLADAAPGRLRNADRSLADWIELHAARTPHALAYEAGDATPLTWSEYDRRSSELAAQLAALGLERGVRIGVLLPDGPDVHVAFVALEKAGLVAMGIGPRAGSQEVEHLLAVSGASAWITGPFHQGSDTHTWHKTLRRTLPALQHHVVLQGPSPEGTTIDGATPPAAPVVPRARRLRPDELFLLNSTSGTTGMPKVVCHDLRRWLAFHEFAVEAGALRDDDVFMSVVPTPFGFGLWTSHVTPTLLGVSTIVQRRFDADEALWQIERHRVTVLAAVTTQFIMMLGAESFADRDLGSLRVLFTGGEAVPYERAAAFEERSGACVLQFYGSNETGAVSRTTLSDSREKRLRTAGRPIAEMNLRLFDESGADVTQSGRGQPGVKGPTLSRGYWENPEAMASLVRGDGWMMLGDLVSLDAEGYLEVKGRVDDFIIRGGKNISGPAVERQVASHPAVALAAAVAMPDPTFGERVCAYVELEPGTSLDLESLLEHLAASGVSKESWPEALVVLDTLPRGSGGKVAKQALRDDAARRAAGRSEPT